MLRLIAFIILISLIYGAFKKPKEKSETMQAKIPAQEPIAPVENNKWQKLNATSYMLKADDIFDISAVVTLLNGRLAASIVDKTTFACEKDQEYPPIPSGPYQVNGTYLKFNTSCRQGIRIISPATLKGNQFLLDNVTSKPTKISLGGAEFKFNGDNFENARKAILEADSAL